MPGQNMKLAMNACSGSPPPTMIKHHTSRIQFSYQCVTLTEQHTRTKRVFLYRYKIFKCYYASLLQFTGQLNCTFWIALICLYYLLQSTVLHCLSHSVVQYLLLRIWTITSLSWYEWNASTWNECTKYKHKAEHRCEINFVYVSTLCSRFNSGSLWNGGIGAQHLQWD